MKKCNLFMIVLILLLQQNLARCEVLNSDSWNYNPMDHPGDIESISNTGGLNHDIEVNVSLSKKFSGIAAGLLLNGVNVIEGRSAAGAAWQTSYLIKDPANNDIYVFNQAAGNSTPFSWGYSTFFNKIQEEYIASTNWLPMYADHKHPNGDFGTSEALCPGYGYSSIAVDDGLERMDFSKIPVSEGEVIKIKNTYTLKSKVNQVWAVYNLEQAFYLSRQVAHDKNLNAYLGYSTDGINIQVYKVFLGGPNYSVPSNICYEAEIIPNKSYKIRPGLKYVIFVWNISGKEIGVAIDMPKSPPFSFGGAHLNTERTVYGSDPNDYSNGNISFHPWLVNLNGSVTFNQGEINNYYLNYYIGTPKQLSELGYKTNNFEIEIGTTEFFGGNLLDANNWSHGLPANKIATIDNNGYYNGVAQNNPWVNGSTVTVSGGVTLTLHADFSAYGCSSFTVTNATINCQDDLFVDNGNLVLNAGSVTTANDDWEANDHAGRITVNGGTHSSGPNTDNNVGAQGNTARIGCGIDFRGGTVTAGNFRFQKYSVSSVGGSAILASAGPSTTFSDATGHIDFLSGWSGSWEVGSFGPGDWKAKIINSANGFTLNGTPIDAARFDTYFNVSGDGTTLSLVVPEPTLLFGCFLLGLAFLRRK